MPGEHVPRKMLYRQRWNQNAHGQYDEFGFQPEHDYPVRCFECNRLMAADFLGAEKKCPNCNREFSLKECRDIAVEAQVINQNYGGWDHKILDRFADQSGASKPSHVDKDLNPVTSERKFEVAKKMTGWANQAARNEMSRSRAHKLRAEKARQALIEQLRSSSSVSNIVRSKIL